MKTEEKTKKFKKGLNKRIIGVLLLLMTLMAGVIITISVYFLQMAYYRQYSEKGQDLVRMLSDEIDGDWIKQFSETLEKDKKYDQIKSFLNRIKNDFTGIQYLYIYSPNETGFVYLIEAQSDTDDPEFISKPGDVYEFMEEDYQNVVPDIKAQRPSQGLLFGPDAGYGKTVISYAPIFDSNGEMVAMIEADYVVADIGARIMQPIARIAAVQAVCIFLVLIIMIIFIRRSVIRPLMRLTSLVDSYEHGELRDNLNRFNSEDEIGSLANSFSEMTVRIDQYIKDLTAVTAEKERIGAELNVATNIQADMLPRIFPAFPERTEFDLFAKMDPAKEVGGDFYDFFMIDEDRLGLVMADVSGKGVPAALFMVIAKTLIKNRALTGNYSGPGEVLEDVNNQLCEGNDADLFVTVWFGILTISTGEITFASAGHEYPVFYRQGKGYVIEKDKHGLPLATFEDQKIKDNYTKLEKGEVLYLYTDGITEATSEDKELFGEERMLETLTAHQDDSVEDLLKNVRADIDAFVGNAPQFDDMTMLAIRYLGQEEK